MDSHESKKLTQDWKAGDSLAYVERKKGGKCLLMSLASFYGSSPTLKSANRDYCPTPAFKPSMESSVCTRRASSSYSKKGKESKTASSSGTETEKKGKRAPSSSSSSSSSSSTPKWKHEVFLSFCGQDTRKSFTDHLYAALKQKGILAFRDDEKLARGKDISQELLKTIQESLYAIVIFSANYATSRWCLNELAEIVKCKRQTRLTILPVFYHVDPSDVRKQRGSFAKAFAKHAKDPKVFPSKTQSWRAALTEVGNIAGWDLRDRHESTVIQEIVGLIFRQLSCRFSCVYRELVGIDSRVMEMMDLLGMGLNDVRFIGIHGMGGVGKTTLSQVIYDRVSHQFEASSFLASVRESSENQGLVLLQKQLLCEILKERKLDVWNVSQGTKMIASRLRYRMVFVVLDDVNTQEQLEALVGARDWFGPGSRIIFTSRDSHLLYSHGGKDIYLYELKGLNDDESLELFSLAAFKKRCPEEDYWDLSKYFVKYAQGLPLALKVLGSFLFGRTKDQWKSAWDELEINPKRKVMDVLQIGFDGLEDSQKNLFLDIACFFKGEFLDSILDILKSFDYFPGINIYVLVEKSLITISMGRLCMHDLLQKMGQEIVRRESPKEPGGRSRLWCNEDVLHVLKHNTETDAVEGVVLKVAPPKKVRLGAKAFSRMKKLRILQIGNRYIQENLWDIHDMLSTLEWCGDPLKSLPSNELRLLELWGYPFQSLPTSFQPNNLVELKMRHSRIKQLWMGCNVSLGNLKSIDLSGSEELIEILDFSGVPNLKRLDLEDCTSLSQVHCSVGVLKRLEGLIIRGCVSLESLPDKVSWESLELIDLHSCSKLAKFPDVVENMTALDSLDFSCTAIKELPFSINNLTGLSSLSLAFCENLSILPSAICSSSTLRYLRLTGCTRLEEFPDLSGMQCLEYMEAIETSITDLPSPDLFPKSTMRVVVSGCKHLPLESKELRLPSREHSRTYDMASILWFSWERFCYLRALRIGYEVEGGCYDMFHIGVGGNILGEYLKDHVVDSMMSGSSFAQEIPEWFKHGHTNSSPFMIRTDVDYDRKWMGYALFIVYEVDECRGFNHMKTFNKEFKSYQFCPEIYCYDQFCCLFDTHGPGVSTTNLDLWVPQVSALGLIGFWVFIPAWWFLENKITSNFDGQRSINASVSPELQFGCGDPNACWNSECSLHVKQLGVRLVYEDDASEFYNAVAPHGLHSHYHHLISSRPDSEGSLPY